MTKKTHKGFFKPFNVQKYHGNPTNIVYRSSWELQMMREFDKNPNVIQWSSERKIINYQNPFTGKLHRYFPDFWVKQKNKQGIVEELIIEIKPLHEATRPPKGKNTKTYKKQLMTYAKNLAKWKAAKRYCEIHNYRFVVITKNKNEQFLLLTEKDLGL